MINVLHLEDDQFDHARYRPVIDRAWEKDPTLSKLGTLHWVSVSKPQEAITCLSEPEPHYSIFFVDLLIPKDPNDPKSELLPDGLNAVEFCSDRCPNVAIIAITAAEQTTKYAGVARDRFLDLGGNAYFSKDMIDHADDKAALYRKLAEQIKQALTDRKILSTTVSHETPRPFKSDQSNFALQAQLEVIGEDPLSSMSAGILPDCLEYEVRYVDPGMSGALVFDIVGYTQLNKGGSRREILLKVSKDQTRLKREIAAHRLVETFFSVGVVPSLLLGEVREQQGWCYIAYQFLSRAITLHTWLTDSAYTPTSSEITHFTAELFTEIGNLHRTHRVKENGSLLEELIPQTKGDRATMLLALDSLWPLVEKYAGAPVCSSDATLRQLIVERKLPRDDHRALFLWQSHGDFHSRNIVVGLRNKTPHVIDFSESAEKHWSADFAKLITRLIVRGWDTGSRSHELQLVPKWRSMVGSLLHGKAPRPGVLAGNERLWATLVEVLRLVPSAWRNIVKTEPPIEEFNISVAVEFLRCATRLDVTSPKRILAIAVAHDLVTEWVSS